MDQKKTGQVKTDRKGFTLLEIVVVLLVLATLVALIAPQTYQIFSRSQEKDTAARLEKLKKAILGDPTIIMNEARTSFGYLGDIGGVPGNLSNLVNMGTQPAYAYNTTLRIGSGWNGPYTDIGTSEGLIALTYDQWGSNLVYNTTEQVDPTTGANIVAKISSPGPDKSSGTGDDVAIHIFLSESFSKTVGFVKDATGNAFAGVAVTMNYPQNGVLVNTTATTDSNGYYTFERVPYGNRSVTINPKLVYSQSSGVTSPSGTRNDVSFKITNFSANDITITSLAAVYTVTPPAYYESVKVGGQTVWTYGTTRAASGNTIPFSPKTIAAGSSAATSLVLRVQSPVTEVPEIIFGKIGTGASMEVDLLDFKDSQTGNAQTVDMTGVSFEITFSDGSIVVFTPVAR